MLLVDPASVMSTMTTAVTLCIDIFHLAVGLHLPRLDGMVVVEDVGAMRGHQGVARGLDGTRVVGGAALQHRGRPIPLPRQAEAGQPPRQYGGGQRSLRPRLPAIGRHLDLGNRASTGPGNPRYLIEPGALQGQTWGGPR